MQDASSRSKKLRSLLDENGKIDLGDPIALLEYNKTVARILGGLEINVPNGNLIPAVCLRYAYVKIIQDYYLKKPGHVIEVGAGASCLMSMFSSKLYGNRLTSSEINEISHESALKNIAQNNVLNIKLLKSNGEILSELFDRTIDYDALLCYPPAYPEEDYFFKKDRGFKGNDDEMLGGGPEGFEFIYKLVSEAIAEFSIRFITVLVLFKLHAKKLSELFHENDISSEIIEVKVGNRIRYIVIGKTKS